MPDSPAVRVSNFSKTYQVPIRCRTKGLWGRLRHFIRNPREPFTAVHDLNFQIDQGEIVGFLGANGSGKSTTIKALTGILTPTRGDISVLGYSPHRQRMAYTQQIGLVLGQKSLLWYNIPVLDSLKLYSEIYGQSQKTCLQRIHYLAELLDIDDALHVPVRKLSLGMRMRAEIVASLIHRPRIIFLDEPTIGLDVVGRRKLKEFLRDINKREGVTIFYTSHNMFDVEDLCPRCIILNKGRLLFDGPTENLKDLATEQTLAFEVVAIKDMHAFYRLLGQASAVEERDSAYTVQVAKADTTNFVAALFQASTITNLKVMPENLECLITKLFDQPADIHELKHELAHVVEIP